MPICVLKALCTPKPKLKMIHCSSFENKSPPSFGLTVFSTNHFAEWYWVTFSINQSRKSSLKGDLLLCRLCVDIFGGLRGNINIFSI